METVPPPIVPAPLPDPWATGRAVVGWVFGFLFVAAQFRGCETADRLRRVEDTQREIRGELERLRAELAAQGRR